MIRDTIKSCMICQKYKGSNPKFSKVVGQSHTKHSFEDISVNPNGPIINTDYVKKNIFTMIDRNTRFCKLVPLQYTTSEDIIKCSESNWINEFGEPSSILTGRGLQYVSEEFKEFPKEEILSI